MFNKILIANRGEIACRVVKTARRMGIGTVAVFSDADRDALHAQMADEAFHIGASPPRESYLAMEKIIDACRRSGAEAVHPGYGFLSENPDFAEALEREGIIFIGPPAGAIRAMGDKIASKKIALEAGVNTIPGWNDVVRDSDHAVEVARSIGYPVMIKASAGGGGKGMRTAANDAECRDCFERCRSEAGTAFGDDRILIEKCIEEPRHIEIQIMADNFGNTLYLAERECSIQRRHQKVIEEAPSPFLDAATRRAMGEQAVLLARAVGYRSAGTVEFIVDRDRNFYFLEMNTRLQVEHPVTEYITGLDLVELMIQVAAGREIGLRQEDVTIRGWAMEARIYAEDPFRNFLPSIGRLVRCIPPEENDHVRVDTGVYEGGEVSIYYDPLIAKLITRGASRKEAAAMMREALNNFHVRGVRHNIGFLQALIGHPRFMEGRLSTHFIAEEYPDGFHGADLPHEEPDLMIVTAGLIHWRFMEREAKLSGQLPGHEKVVEKNWVVRYQGENHEVTVERANAAEYMITYGDRIYSITTGWRFGQPLFHGDINGAPVSIQVECRGLRYHLTHGGSEANVLVLTPRAAELNGFMVEKKPADLSRFVLSPMPGLLARVLVAAGQEVKAGEDLAIVEAMKMENTLRAAHDGTIKAVLAAPGDSLAVDQAILEFEQEK